MENITQKWEQMTYPFVNLKLNYSLDALEPYIDHKTMRIHYDLLANEIKNLNHFLEAQLDLQNMNLSELLSYAETNQDNILRHLVGGIYNHFFFFSELRPATGQIIIGITPQATQKITVAFGGWKKFKEQIATATLNVCGSGYVWLVKDNKGELRIITTNNYDIPTGTPILCIDVWEHAYYLQYPNERQTYVDAFWNIVDWVKFSEKI